MQVVVTIMKSLPLEPQSIYYGSVMSEIFLAHLSDTFICGTVHFQMRW